MGNNLAEALVALVRDVEPGFMLLLSWLCYLFGLVVFWQGCMRLLKMSRGPVSCAGDDGDGVVFCAVQRVCEFAELDGGGGR